MLDLVPLVEEGIVGLARPQSAMNAAATLSLNSEMWRLHISRNFRLSVSCLWDWLLSLAKFKIIFDQVNSLEVPVHI